MVVEVLEGEVVTTAVGAAVEVVMLGDVVVVVIGAAELGVAGAAVAGLVTPRVAGDALVLGAVDLAAVEELELELAAYADGAAMITIAPAKIRYAIGWLGMVKLPWV